MLEVVTRQQFYAPSQPRRRRGLTRRLDPGPCICLDETDRFHRQGATIVGQIRIHHAGCDASRRSRPNSPDAQLALEQFEGGSSTGVRLLPADCTEQQILRRVLEIDEFDDLCLIPGTLEKCRTQRIGCQRRESLLQNAELQHAGQDICRQQGRTPRADSRVRRG